LKDTEVAIWSGVVDFIEGTQRPHNSQDWLETVLPWTWDENAECPTWLKALARWFQGDPQWKTKLLALQEFFGYCLLGHAKYKKALVAYGDPNTGKSVVMTVMTELVGQDNTCSISVEDMDDPRKVAPIKGKLLNVMSDLTAKSLIADGGFKRLVSTGDAIQIDEKFKAPHLYIPKTKHAVATNILPRIDDKTWGTFERLLVIRFPNVIPAGEMDRNLTAKLVEEMPGILNWAIAGARRLYENAGQFTKIAESEELLEEYREDQNPVFAFLEEKCDWEEGHTIPYTEFWEKFVKWYGKPLSRSALGRWIGPAGVETAKKRDGHRTVKVICDYRWQYGEY